MSSLVETYTESKPLAVIAGPDGLTLRLAQKLEQKGFSIYCFDPESSALPAIIKPDYLFYLLPGEPWVQTFRRFAEVCHWVKKPSPKIIILGLALGLPQQAYLETYLRQQNLVARRVNLSANGVDQEQLFVDYLFTPESVSGWRQFSTNWNFALVSAHLVDNFSPKPRSTNKKRFVIFFVTFIAAGFFFLAWIFLPATLALNTLIQVKTTLSDRKAVKDTIPLQSKLLSAKDNFSLTRERVKIFSGLGASLGRRNKFLALDNLLSLGQAIASSGYHGISVSSNLQQFFTGVVSPNSPTYTVSSIALLGPELSKLDQDLGLLSADINSLTPFWKKIVRDRYGDWISNISGTRQILRILSETSPHWGEILGDSSKKTYLLALQNPAELRPSGGFLGSFGLLTFDKGKLLTFQINDIYSADGQFKIHVAPPDEILHFLGQPNWYMRDANWSADFPLTARRLEWFLDKEMGITVSGVIGIDLHAVENLLQASGPVDLPDFGEKVTAENFFEKAEFRSEIKFFPGSTQKPDFISAVANELVLRLESGRLDRPDRLLSAIIKSTIGKNIQVYFDDPGLQRILAQNSVTGELRPDYCLNNFSICLAQVDANLGANKSNYYLERNFNLAGQISQDGDLDFVYKINLINHSPNNTWPGGSYKDYLRIYLPLGSTVNSFSIGDNRTASISAILTAKALADLPKEKFLVKMASESGYLELGTLVEVPSQKNKTVEIRFRTPQKFNLDLSEDTVRLNMIKQAGTPADKWSLMLDYPSFLTLAPSPLNTLGTLDTGTRLEYNTILDRDLKLVFKFLFHPR